MDLSFLCQLDPERDPKYRIDIEKAVIRGLRLTGLLGIFLIAAYITTYAALGRELAWGYGHADAIALVDKAVIAGLCALLVGFSFVRLGSTLGRMVLGVAVIAAVAATITDDVLGDNVRYSSAWISLILFGGVSIIPYRNWETALLGFAAVCVFIISHEVVPAIAGLTAPEVDQGQVIYLVLMTLLAAGISHARYRSRHDAYLVRMKLHDANERMAEQAAHLRKINLSQAKFFANISHEFRTPLTLILGPVEDTLRGSGALLSAELKQRLEMVQRNAIRLLSLINELLDLSRLDEGKAVLNTGTYDLVSFVQSEVEGFRQLAEIKKIKLVFEADEGSVPTVFDCMKLEKAVVNLLSNAVKFTPDSGTILVRVELSDIGDRRISVRDTGPGVMKEDLDHLFDRFYQASSESVSTAISTKLQGSGIGLALVKEFVELHGGKVTVESEVGFGSTFTIVLPVGEVTDPVTKTGLSDPLSDDTSLISEYGDTAADDHVDVPEDAPLILVVDDNSDVRSYLRQQLVHRYRVMEAVGGVQALELIEREKPVLVISDVMMPNMDGNELCRILKSNPETMDIPVVLVTARAADEMRWVGLQAGADDYLFKPFSASDLMLRIENLIEIRRRLRAAFRGRTVLGPTEISVESADSEFMAHVCEVIEEHLPNSNFGVNWLASEVGLSTRQLQRRVRSATDLSVAGVIRMLRIGRAAQLLAGRGGTISEIAYEVGYNDASHFSQLYRQTYGVTPSEYRTDAGNAKKSEPEDSSPTTGS